MPYQEPGLDFLNAGTPRTGSALAGGALSPAPRPADSPGWGRPPGLGAPAVRCRRARQGPVTRCVLKEQMTERQPLGLTSLVRISDLPFIPTTFPNAALVKQVEAVPVLLVGGVVAEAQIYPGEAH